MSALDKAVYSMEDLANWGVAGAALHPAARLAVIGDPINHSKSPQMHNPALRAAGLDAQYIRVQVPVGRVAEAFRLFTAAGFWGVNVTIPHKFEALDAVEFVDPLAKTLGAVNTVAIRPDGLHGYNSDGPGFLRAVQEGFGAKAADLRVMILGAGGGAGRAVAVQCALAGCKKIILVNRTLSKAEALRNEVQASAQPGAEVRVVEWADSSVGAELPGVQLVVNGSPVGMKEGDPHLVPSSGLRPDHLLFDMVYRAGGALTSLGRAARAAGARYVDGSFLLLHQGAISFEHWFKRPAPIEEMRAGLAAALRS